MDKIKTIVVAKDFTDAPGARFRDDGPYSGQAFREDCLIPALEELGEDEILTIDFDGAYGYPPSFLEEAFGGLVRKYGDDKIFKKITFISKEEPSQIEQIKRYIKNAI